MEITKCKICGIIFFRNNSSGTDYAAYDYDCCYECNREAEINTNKQK